MLWKGTSTVLPWLATTALMSWTFTFISGMLSGTGTGMVSTGTSMPTATSPNCFWLMWRMPGVWSCPSVIIPLVSLALVGRCGRGCLFQD